MGLPAFSAPPWRSFSRFSASMHDALRRRLHWPLVVIGLKTSPPDGRAPLSSSALLCAPAALWRSTP
jgi:hypothetical protein